MDPMLALPLLAAVQTPIDELRSVPPPFAAEPAVLSDLLAFGETGLRMTVPVRIAGGGPYGFIVDTGAQRTVISRELAHALRLAPGPIVRLTAMTGTSAVPTVLIPSLSVSTTAGQRIEAPALGHRDLGAQGMIGVDVLQRRAVAIDFESRTLAVSGSEKRRPSSARRAPGEIVVRARNLLGQLVVTDATVAGRRVRVILDTGSAVTMGNEALRRALAAPSGAGNRIELTSVTGGTLVADYSVIRSIRVGDLTLRDMPVAYADAPPFRAFGLEGRPALMLGMDALRLFRRVDIDFANREVRFLAPRGG